MWVIGEYGGSKSLPSSGFWPAEKLHFSAGVTFHLSIPQWSRWGLSWEVLRLLGIHGLLGCQGPFSAQKLTWGRDESWQWDKLPEENNKAEFREATWLLWQILSGKMPSWGHLGERAGSLSECWARLGRGLGPRRRLRCGREGQCIIHTLDVLLYLEAGCVHCVGSFPMAVWLGHQTSNGMLLVECETEISSGRNWRDFTKTLGKLDFPDPHGGYFSLIFTERKILPLFFSFCSSFKIPYLPSSCCRNTQTHDITFLFWCNSNKKLKSSSCNWEDGTLLVEYHVSLKYPCGPEVLS